MQWVPNTEKGEAIFNGEALPSKEVLDMIGSLGVDFIIKELEKKLKMHQELFGDGCVTDYGMSPHQRFYHLQNRIALDVKAITERPTGTHIEDYRQDFSIEVGEPTLLLLKKYESSDATVKRLIKSGIFYKDSN